MFSFSRRSETAEHAVTTPPTVVNVDEQRIPELDIPADPATFSTPAGKYVAVVLELPMVVVFEPLPVTPFPAITISLVSVAVLAHVATPRNKFPVPAPNGVPQ